MFAFKTKRVEVTHSSSLSEFDPIVRRSRTKHPHTHERKHTHTGGGGLEKGDKAESRQLVVPNLTLFLSFFHNDTLSFICFSQFLIRQIFFFFLSKLIIVLRCWVLDSNYYSGCCCYIISLSGLILFYIIFLFYIAVIYIDFKCVLSKL